MQLAKILFPFDYSERCRRAAAVVKSLAEKTGAQLTVMNIIADPATEYPASAAFLVAPKECDEMLAFSNTYLQKYIQETFPGCTVDAVCKMGNPAKHIVSAAKTRDVDLIMMPTRGCGEFRRLLLGSVTAKVLHDATCPVWTDAHLEQQEGSKTFCSRNILCAVNTKEESKGIIRYASDLAHIYSGKVRLIHVLPELDPAFKHLRPEIALQYHSTAKYEIAAIRDEASLDAEICIEEGTISEVIQRVATASQSDLIVIGRGHLQHTLGRLRTNAYAIIRDSPCPVLSV